MTNLLGGPARDAYSEAIAGRHAHFHSHAMRILFITTAHRPEPAARKVRSEESGVAAPAHPVNRMRLGRLQRFLESGAGSKVARFDGSHSVSSQLSLGFRQMRCAVVPKPCDRVDGHGLRRLQTATTELKA
jgi:hypothetical protein